VSLACTTPARTIVACDVSLNGLRQAGRLAQRAGVGGRTHLVQADAHRLPFRDRSFDHVIGGAILHHLDLSQASHEIRRVVRPGGHAVFCENNGDNVVLRFVWATLNRMAWFALETGDAHPLRAEELAHLADRFGTCTVWVPYVTLFTTLAWRRPLRRGKAMFQMLDAILSNPLTNGCSMSRWIRLEA
jgi:SAM-dependent methyltransferase